MNKNCKILVSIHTILLIICLFFDMKEQRWYHSSTFKYFGSYVAFVLLLLSYFAHSIPCSNNSPYTDHLIIFLIQVTIILSVISIFLKFKNDDYTSECGMPCSCLKKFNKRCKEADGTIVLSVYKDVSSPEPTSSPPKDGLRVTDNKIEYEYNIDFDLDKTIQKES